MIAGTDYAVSPDIAWTEARDVRGLPLVYVAPIPDGPISVLPDMAALIWLAPVSYTHLTLPTKRIV